MSKVYKVSILPRAQKFLAKMPTKDRERVRDRIRALATEPRPHGYAPVKGTDFLKIRSGNYRVVYDVNDQGLTVLVVKVGDRKDVYDEF